MEKEGCFTDLPSVNDGAGMGKGDEVLPGPFSVGDLPVQPPLGTPKSGEFRKNGTMRRF